MLPIINTLSSNPYSALSFAALLLAIISLWSPNHFKFPALFFCVYLLFSWCSQHIQPIAFLFIAALGFSFFIAEHYEFNKILRFIMGVCAIALSLGFFIHTIPGIINIKIIDQLILSAHSSSFNMYLNFDKPLVGLFILYFGNRLIQTNTEWKTALIKTSPIAISGFVIMLIAAYSVQFIIFEPKYTSVFWLWAISNLFFTVVAEEALCRGFIQHYFDRALQKFRSGKFISLITVSLFFGALHYTGGWHYILLASLAGMIYGYVYQKTERIEASILTHFSLNVIHFLLFTYPDLAMSTS